MSRADARRDGDARCPPRRLILFGPPDLLPSGPFPGYAPVVAERADLPRLLPREPPSTMVLADPFAAGGDDPDPLLREAMARWPSVPVVAAFHATDARVPAMRRLIEWGVSELVDLSLERRPEMVAVRLRAAHARPFKRRLEAGVSRYASAGAMTLVHAAAAVTVDRGTRRDLADFLGVSERTAAALCAREALPAPRQLLRWMRVLLAAMLLEEPERSVAGVAHAAGYKDHASLRRAMALLADPHAGREATRDWSFDETMDRLNFDMRALREEIRAERRRRRAERAGGG